MIRLRHREPRAHANANCRLVDARSTLVEVFTHSRPARSRRDLGQTLTLLAYHQRLQACYPRREPP